MVRWRVMPIVLKETDNRLRDACREVERRCAGEEHPPITVEVLPNLDKVDGKNRPDYIRRSEAVSDPVKRIIYVNDARFWGLSEEERVAVLVHEVGHFFTKEGADGCLDADCFACAHGCEAALLGLRERTNGMHYRAVLAQWRAPERTKKLFQRYNFIKSMNWEMPSPEELAATPDAELEDPFAELTAAMRDAVDDPG